MFNIERSREYHRDGPEVPRNASCSPDTRGGKTACGVVSPRIATQNERLSRAPSCIIPWYENPNYPVLAPGFASLLDNASLGPAETSLPLARRGRKTNTRATRITFARAAFITPGGCASDLLVRGRFSAGSGIEYA